MPIEDRHWDTLVSRVQSGDCTPILGAGASAHAIPLGVDVAQSLARHIQKHPLPESDRTDLARVAQTLSVERRDAYVGKSLVSRIIEDAVNASAPRPQDPHRLLAALRLPLYITTNYDDFMVRALRALKVDVIQECCRWNNTLAQLPSAFDRKFSPSRERPVVFHLHGYAANHRTLVLSEDDYLDFLVNLSQDVSHSDSRRPMLPYAVRNALKNNTLMFIGYRLADINFRVILRGLLGTLEPSQRSFSVIVQLPPVRQSERAEEVARMQAYVEDYFGWTMNLQVFWGSAQDFLMELTRRAAVGQVAG